MCYHINDSNCLLQASSPPSSFPLSYLINISSLLRAHHQLLTTCVSTSLLPHTPSSLTQKVSPPVTILTITYVSMQFQFCVSRFQSLAEDFSILYSSLFDADSTTLSHISLYPYFHSTNLSPTSLISSLCVLPLTK